MPGHSSLSRRRQVLAGAAAFAALPALAAAQPLARPPAGAAWARTAGAARGLDQLHALVIAHRGEVVLAEAFRGPPVDRAVNVKSVSKTIVAALTGAAIDRGEIAGLDATLGTLIPDLIPRRGRPAREGHHRGGPRDHAGRARAHLGTGLRRVGLEPRLGRLRPQPPFRRRARRPHALLHRQHARARGGAQPRLGPEPARARPRPARRPARHRDPRLDPRPAGLLSRRQRDGPRAAGADPLRRDVPRRRALERRGGAERGPGSTPRWCPAPAPPSRASTTATAGFSAASAASRLALARGYGGQILCLVPDLALTVAITSDPTRPARSEGYFGELRRLIADAVIPDAERV